ncbi:hypothetical protein K435DRAFT_854212 [Dendrothele bispora CBS 962.96]|uniref:Uncharacterized protein n=1 Tax=Dendrothele bispora (strain CBS 962.96) TaxID=1314807 RepID=A0A4S8MFS8_DENBC|nr:hypothetical protein K435DRAFT_854212 [Dendrothele bispora CBS 962.96]
MPGLRHEENIYDEISPETNISGSEVWDVESKLKTLRYVSHYSQIVIRIPTIPLEFSRPLLLHQTQTHITRHIARVLSTALYKANITLQAMQRPDPIPSNSMHGRQPSLPFSTSNNVDCSTVSPSESLSPIYTFLDHSSHISCCVLSEITSFPDHSSSNSSSSQLSNLK